MTDQSHHGRSARFVAGCYAKIIWHFGANLPGVQSAKPVSLNMLRAVAEPCAWNRHYLVDHETQYVI